MGSSRSRRTKVFVSYSHKDSEWGEALHKHLRASLGEGTAWIDQVEIEAGERWEEEIRFGLEETRVALLLLSIDFLTSDFIKRKELPYLLEADEKGEITLLPIFVRACDVPSELNRYQGINSPETWIVDLSSSDQDKTWVKTAREVRKILSELVLVTVAHEELETAEGLLGRLEERGLELDVEAYRDPRDPGFEERVKLKLESRQKRLLLIGRGGLGPWREGPLYEGLRAESHGILARSSAYRSLISARLPGAPDDLEMPAFLPKNTEIRFDRGLEDTKTFERLWTGLTGRSYSPPTPSPDPIPDPVPDPIDPDPEPGIDVDELAARLAFENATIFLSCDLAPSPGRPGEGEVDLPPRLYELARHLLEDFDLAGPEGERLLLPIDLAGAYYAVRNTERRLETRLCDMVGARTRLPRTHRQIARLLHRLGELETSGRLSRRCHPPTRLIVTTNIDLSMERALLLEGVPFVRLVQDRSGDKIVINEYQSAAVEDGVLTVRTGEDERKFKSTDADRFRDAIAELGREKVVYRDPDAGLGDSENPLRGLPLERFEERVLLYKFQGSEDVQRSCAISIDQHFRLLRAILEKNVIPLKITEYLSEGPVLVLGYSLLDPPFRMLFHTFALDTAAELGGDPRFFLVRSRPERNDPDEFRRLEHQLWDGIRKKAENANIELVEQEGDRFVQALIDGLEERWGGADEARRD